MTSREDDQARILAGYVDDLLADREPRLPPEAARVFTPSELAAALSTARFMKGLLRPSTAAPAFLAQLQDRLLEQVRAEPASVAAAKGVDELLADGRRAAGVAVAAIAAEVGLPTGDIESLEAGMLPPVAVAPERLLAWARTVLVPASELVAAARVSAELWLERLVRRLAAASTGLASLHRGGPSPAQVDALRREEAELLAHHLAELERLASDIDRPAAEL